MTEIKLTPNETIITALRYLNAGNNNGAYDTFENYLKTLSSSGDVAHRLRRLLNDRPYKFTAISELKHDVKRLISEVHLQDECVYLKDSDEALFDSLLKEWKHKEFFRMHNLNVRNKILFYGLTGNGKTTIARHIAKISGLPLVEIKSDLVVEGRLGSTQKNINDIFSQINSDCILFWDEIDTIGRKRGNADDSASNENDRMVNSILMNLDKLNHDVVFIGATNRYDVLDNAFLRRFDVKYEVAAPHDKEKRKFVSKLSEFYKIPENIFTYDLNNFESYSDLKQVFIESARSYILNSIEKQS